MVKTKLFLSVISLFIALIAITLLWGKWDILLSMLLLIWANNLSIKAGKGKE